jgi:hypothetical protein
MLKTKNMIKIKYFFLFALTIISVGCTVQRQSKFTSDVIKPGMSKEAVIALYGKPYKESSSSDNNKALQESFYYKEILFLGRWYEVNNILHFEDSVLKSLEQGEEQLLDKGRQVIVR